MIAGALDLIVNRGVSFGPLVFRCKDINGALVPLAGWIPFASVRRRPDGPLIIDLNPVITNPDGGEVTIQFSDEETAAMPAGSYRWDLLFQQPDGDVKGPFISGRFVVTSLVTKT